MKGLNGCGEVSGLQGGDDALEIGGGSKVGDSRPEGVSYRPLVVGEQLVKDLLLRRLAGHWLRLDDRPDSLGRLRGVVEIGVEDVVGLDPHDGDFVLACAPDDRGLHGLPSPDEIHQGGGRKAHRGLVIVGQRRT